MEYKFEILLSNGSKTGFITDFDSEEKAIKLPAEMLSKQSITFGNVTLNTSHVISIAVSKVNR